jgi:hypothetical protein
MHLLPKLAELAAFKRQQRDVNIFPGQPRMQILRDIIFHSKQVCAYEETGHRVFAGRTDTSVYGGEGRKDPAAGPTPHISILLINGKKVRWSEEITAGDFYLTRNRN